MKKIIVEYLVSSQKTAILEDDKLIELLIEDNSKYSKESIRELRLDTTKLQSEGIVFSPTKEAIHNCLKEFGIIH